MPLETAFHPSRSVLPAHSLGSVVAQYRDLYEQMKDMR